MLPHIHFATTYIQEKHSNCGELNVIPGGGISLQPAESDVELKLAAVKLAKSNVTPKWAVERWNFLGYKLHERSNYRCPQKREGWVLTTR